MNRFAFSTLNFSGEESKLTKTQTKTLPPAQGVKGSSEVQVR